MTGDSSNILNDGPYFRALDAYRRGDFVNCQYLLRDAISLVPAHTEANHLMGVLLAREKKFDAAEKHFLNAIANAPDKHEFRCNYALMLHEQGFYSEATTLFERVIAAMPNFPPAYNGCGAALFSQGKLLGAADSFRKAIECQPNNPVYHNNLGNVLKECCDYEAAISSYEVAIKLNERYAEAHLNLGHTLKYIHQYEKARKHLHLAISIQPEYQQARTELNLIGEFWQQPMSGNRVTLKPYDTTEASFLHQVFNNDDFMSQYNRMIPRKQSLSGITAELKRNSGKLPWFTRSADWVIKSNNENQKPIGLINLTALDFKNQNAEIQIGSYIRSANYNAATVEAVLMVFDLAFNKANLNKIISIIYEGNGDSRSVTMGFGFKEEGFRKNHIKVSDSEFIGYHENGMTVEDFRSSRVIRSLSLRYLRRDITLKVF